MNPDLDLAVTRFLAENAQLFATIGSQGRTVLTAALGDPDLAAVVDATYIAGRRNALTSLVEQFAVAGRLGTRSRRQSLVLQASTPRPAPFEVWVFRLRR